MKFGLKDEVIIKIVSCFRNFTEIREVIIFGSRAKGTYKNGSDIDLCINNDIKINVLANIENQLDELLLPYKIDICLKNEINNEELKNHIERVGEIFYKAA